MNLPIKNPTSVGAQNGAIKLSQQCNCNPVDAVLQRLESVKPEGKGYRALCPACSGKSRKLTIVEGDDGRALIHCFGCNDTRAVLDAIGLKWADIYPFRNWPESPEEKRKASRAMREAGQRSAIGVVAHEAVRLCVASGMIQDGIPLTPEDHNRLLLSYARLFRAWEILQ